MSATLDREPATPASASSPGNGPPASAGPVSAIQTCRRVTMLCSMGGASLGALALIGWGTGATILASFGAEKHPMAPLVALGFLVLGSALFLHVRFAGYRLARAYVLMAALLVALVGLLKLVDFFGDIELERTVLRVVGMPLADSPPPPSRDPSPDVASLSGTPHRGAFTSPITATSFLLAGIVLLLLRTNAAAHRRWLTASCVSVLILGNAWILLGYLERAQETLTQYYQIAVAPTTAIAWLFFGLGLITAEGPAGIFLRRLVGGSTRALLLRAFLPLTVATALIAGILRSNALMELIGAGGPGLKSTTLLTLPTVISVLVLGMLVAQIARRIGEALDRAESERRHALEELRHARDAAEASSRSKSQFLANMSHELRTPLNAIIGYSELLEEEAQEVGQGDFIPDLQRIHAAGKHLLSLINDILDISKIEAGKIELCLETFDLAGMLQDVATTIRPLVEKNGNTLKVDHPADLGKVHADLTRLRQCLFNLLSNAGKFTEKGTVTLRVGRDTREGRDWLIFRVSDTGIGMTPEQTHKLFQPFTQADNSTTRKYGGTGLGLAISLKLSQLMGGTIAVESEVGQGSTFTLQIPAEVKKPQASKSHPEIVLDAPLPASTGNTILVVDDDPEVQELLHRFLTGEGFQVIVATGGEQALRAAREMHPQVITLDVMMPGMDGWSVLSALKADSTVADIPVIMLTIVDDKNLGYALGAADYLTKPLDRNRLIKTLKRYCKLPANQALVVEDDDSTREMLRRMLEKDGWTVAEASNGIAALECLARRRPALILLDLMMPEMDGFEFLGELRQHPEWQSIPVVVVTAKDLTPEDRLFLNGSLMLSGCVKRVLQKGAFNRDDLLREVHALVKAHTGEATPTGLPASETH